MGRRAVALVLAAVVALVAVFAVVAVAVAVVFGVFVVDARGSRFRSGLLSLLGLSRGCPRSGTARTPGKGT
eukprot:716308-Pyramimonas_sp.AAC.1